MSDILIVGTGKKSLENINIELLSTKMKVLCINYAANIYNFSDYIIAADKLNKDSWWNYNGQKIITSEQNELFIKQQGWNPHYIFRTCNNIINEFNHEHYLTYKNFTFVSAFSWAYCKGFKNIYTAGIELDYQNWDYIWNAKNNAINPNLLNNAIKTLLEYKKMLNKKNGDIYTFWKSDKIGLKYIDYNKLIGGF